MPYEAPAVRLALLWTPGMSETSTPIIQAARATLNISTVGGWLPCATSPYPTSFSTHALLFCAFTFGSQTSLCLTALVCHPLLAPEVVRFWSSALLCRRATSPSSISVPSDSVSVTLQLLHTLFPSPPGAIFAMASFSLGYRSPKCGTSKMESLLRADHCTCVGSVRRFDSTDCRCLGRLLGVDPQLHEKMFESR